MLICYIRIQKYNDQLKFTNYQVYVHCTIVFLKIIFKISKAKNLSHIHLT